MLGFFNTKNRSDQRDDLNYRDVLSDKVFSWSFGFIACLTIFVIIYPIIIWVLESVFGADFKNDDFHRDIYMSILPIMSGWVGGVLGFYFSDRAAEARGEQVMQAQRGAVALSDRLKQVPVTEVMVSLARIEKIILSPATDVEPIGAGNSFKEMKDVIAKPGYTRTPMFLETSNGLTFHAIAHESVIYKYDSLLRSQNKDPDITSIADFLVSDIYRERAKGSTAFVSRLETLEDAKSAMQRLKGAQDVIITKSGEQDAPVVGWLTNVDILRWSVARAED